MVKIASYGTWTSPITAGDTGAAGGGFQWADLHGEQVWWAESRPAEGGRVALVRDGVEVLPAPWNARNRVHEYGGRPFVVLAHDRVAFTHWDDQRVYVFDPASPEPVPLTEAPRRHHGVRYSDLSAGPDGEVWCVRESVTGDARTDVHRDLVAITRCGEVRVLGASHHFMTGPKLSPDGTRFAWIGWNHPQMPWDGTELCVADVGSSEHRVVTGSKTEAVCQFEWEGEDLLALTDPDGWWNLFRVRPDGSRENLAPCEQELGGPMWRLGNRWFATLSPGRYLVVRSGHLAVLDERSATVTDVQTDLPTWAADLSVRDGVVVCGAAGPTSDYAVVRLDLSNGELTYLTGGQQSPVSPYLPVPVERVFGDIPAYVYAPSNPDFAGPQDELPPYVVHVHGGPTGRALPKLDTDIAYFTSRGIGVVAVNYGGSTGYGREFRERLRGQWGVVDVQDCAFVARQLAQEGTADPARLGIRGGSAGGWTAAASLTSTRVYRCGMVAFPILDLAGWTSQGGETHDFESRYVEGLAGALPEAAQRYAERSPSTKARSVSGPVLLLQGLEDEICPPEQANRFAADLAGSGIPHAYLTFEGEQHGFRKAENIKAALEAELSFYGQAFGFVPPGVPVLDLSR
ncbi:prolyl oligopeptidase family serine peptidase [Lentzea sp. CC55]|uniref:prolyl oligopeptidase family serine peptidase n=1 Tax=Lentzea sp. CC55 TaxID=2884909 RepID=UPI0027DED199|nr:prolyl oligopeptidase family serine peptidase [Lentzea sp. CC55]MCG8927177.1 prolyl oligopeptidase family serine peptidase [Lentzea sp. CC55]